MSVGADIHCYAEVLKNGKWEYSNNQFSRNRDYWAFHFLAEVRDKGPFGCAQLPKGIPTNVSPEVDGLQKSWGSDGHSHSHFTLDELLSHIKYKTNKYCCLIPMKQYKDLQLKMDDLEDFLNNTVDDVNMILSEDEANDLINKNLEEENSKKYVNKFFKFNIMQDSSLIRGIVSHLTIIAKGENLTNEKVRLVFWFDN